MSMEDRDGFIWLNGHLVKWREAKIHSLTHGLHYASCVFEGERAYYGNIFKSQAHTQRLFASAKFLNFTIPYSQKDLLEAKEVVIAANNLENSDACYIRPFAFLNANTLGLLGCNSGVNTIIAAWQWSSASKHGEPGLRLSMATYKRPSPETIPSHAKAAGLYMICTISKNNAIREGFDDALMLDYRGYIAEATGANIFFVMGDGRLHTPKADCFLNGITRQTIIELAQENSIEVVERHIRPEEIRNAKECFLTGTSIEIAPVAEIADTYRFHCGSVSKKLIEAYNTAVRYRV